MTDQNVMTVPAHIIARMEARKADPSKRSAALDAVVSDGMHAPRISTRASRFRLVDSGVETVVGITLDVVIVRVNPSTSKTYFDKAYDPDNKDQAPRCSSDDGKRPDARIADPIHDNCATCPKNVVGSKVTDAGKKLKACTDHRDIAVVAAADPGKVYALSVPVSGMTGLREYFKHLSNYGAIPEEVVTVLGFDDKESYPKLTFALKSFLAEKHIANIERIAESDEAKVATRELTGPDALALPAGEAAPAQKPAGLVTGKPEPEEALCAVPEEAAPEAQGESDNISWGEPSEEEEAPEPKAKPKPKAKPAAAKPAVVEDATPEADRSELDKALDDMFG